MTQSNKHSIVETTTNVGTGFFVGVMLNYFVLPMFAVDIATGSVITALTIGLIYTSVSWIRSYAFRRIFNHLTEGVKGGST